MSDKAPAILTDPLTDLSASKPALGAVLRAARKKQEMSVEEAAQQLRMSPRQVLALEEDNLAALTTPAFVRGFIRNYARLLKLDAEPLLETYRAMQPDPGHHAAISLHSEHIAFTDHARKAWGAYALGSLLVLLLGAGWLFYKEKNTQQPAPVRAEKPNTAESSVAQDAAPKPPANTPEAESASVAVPMPPADPAPVATANPTLPVTVVEPTPVSASAPVTTVPVATAGAIHMVFSEQTWVSVVDSTGKEVFNKTKAAGTEDNADGTPPFKVVIGNATGAKVFYRDKPYDIAPYTKSNVARLTLE